MPVVLILASVIGAGLLLWLTCLVDPDRPPRHADAELAPLPAASIPPALPVPVEAASGLP